MADKYFTYEMSNGAQTVLLAASSPSIDALARDAAAKNRAAVGGFKVKDGTLQEHASPEARQAFVAEYRKRRGKAAEPTDAERKRNREKVFGKIDLDAVAKAAGAEASSE